MESTNPAHEACLKKARDFVRNELKIDEFTITDEKIICFCREHDDKPSKAIKSLKKLAERMTQLDLKRVQALPKSVMNSCKPQFGPICLHVKNVGFCLQFFINLKIET